MYSYAPGLRSASLVCAPSGAPTMNEVLASQSAASRLLSNVTVARAAFVKPNGTCTPLPKAIWLPAENVEMPVAIVAFGMSTVTLTSRDSPGFSVNDAGLTVTFCPVFVGTVAVRLAAAVPRFVRRTVFVADHDACDGESRPYDSTGGSATTPTPAALSASMRPPPVAITSSLTFAPVATSAALTCAGAQSRS